MGVYNGNGIYNNVDLEFVPSEASADNKLVTQQQLDEAADLWSAGYTPKGPATVSTINGLTGQQNGDVYMITDSGIVNPGAVTVSEGDQIAWDAADSVWYKFTEYARKQSVDNIENELNIIDGVQITYSLQNIGALSDGEDAENEPFYGYASPVKNISNLKKVIVSDILTSASTGDDTTCTMDILDGYGNVQETATATVKTLATQCHNYNVVFIFENPVSITTGYVRISCPVKISYTDARNATLGDMFDTDRVGKYLQTYDGAWSDLTASQTKQFSLGITFFVLVDVKESKINLVTDGCIIKYVTSAQELVDALEEASLFASSSKWYNIHIASGEYNLLPFIDLDSIVTVTATGYRGIEVPRFTRLIGDKSRRPHIYVDLTEETTTTEQQWTVSALNLRNDSELYNLIVTGKQCRYAVHDDGGNTAYKRYCENCTFIHYQNTSAIVWTQQAAYGNGIYKGCVETFKDCDFIAYHEAFYIHDNHNYNVSSNIILDNCRFATDSKPQAAKFESMGASAITSILIKNCSFNADILKKINDVENDSIEITGWKNSIDTTLGVNVVES